jgi:hypothetical protein
LVREKINRGGSFLSQFQNLFELWSEKRRVEFERKDFSMRKLWKNAGPRPQRRIEFKETCGLEPPPRELPGVTLIEGM